MAVGSIILRFGALVLRILQFCCAAIALGIFSYFLWVLNHRDLTIATRWKAVEGLTAGGTIYTIFGLIFVLCLGGKKLFGFTAIALDLVFAGAFAAVAYYTRHGASKCRGNVRTPLGEGSPNSNPPGNGSSSSTPKLGFACRLNTVVFAVSIIAIFLFLISAIWQLLMVRKNKEKTPPSYSSNRYAESPAKAPLWKRVLPNKIKSKSKDVEGASNGVDMRQSHDSLGSTEYYRAATTGRAL